MTKELIAPDKRNITPFLLVSLLLMVGCQTQETKPLEPVAVETQVQPETTVSTKLPTPVTKQAPASGPDSPTSKIYLGSDGKIAGTGTPERPASEVYRLGKGVHPKALSLPGLPKDKFGLTDWNLMVEKGIINPADSLEPGRKETPLLDLDIHIKTKSDFVNNVLFRHKPHVYWLSCKNCHTGMFVMAKGKNKMSMQGIVKGKWCGECHGKVSFPLTDCNRCHSQPKR